MSTKTNGGYEEQKEKAIQDIFRAREREIKRTTFSLTVGHLDSDDVSTAYGGVPNGDAEEFDDLSSTYIKVFPCGDECIEEPKVTFTKEKLIRFEVQGGSRLLSKAELGWSGDYLDRRVHEVFATGEQLKEIITDFIDQETENGKRSFTWVEFT